MSNPVQLSLVDLTAALQARKLSPVELLSAVFRRLDERNAELNAVVAMYDRDALFAQARDSETRIARGNARPLEGVPLGVKDLEDCAGLITSHGSIPYRENLATHDSVQVERLRSAGAIPIGKTNAPEFGYTAITKNLIFGVTRNPWNTALTPGGSSGGSSAALSACILPLVTASDGGGSTRIPASFVGAFGLKPTFGRIPNESKHLWSYGDTAVQGPLTKTVADNALYLDVTSGYSPEDPSSLPHPGFSYRTKLADGVPRKLRIAYSPDLGYAKVDKEIAALVKQAVKVFADLGAQVDEVDPGFDDQLEVFTLHWFPGAAYVIRSIPAAKRKLVDKGLLEVARQGEKITMKQHMDAVAKRGALGVLMSQFHQKYDLLLTPTLPVPAFDAGKEFPGAAKNRRWTDWTPFSYPFNLTQQPAASIPCGLTKAGLPAGLHIVGPKYGDALVLRAARAYETVRPVAMPALGKLKR